MTTEAQALLDRAEDGLRVAELILASGEPGFAASPAYYAVFYCAEALLLSLGLSYSSHSATLAAFGQHFVKMGRMEPKFHRYLIEAYRTRQVADYEPTKKVSEAEARRVIERGQEFLAAGRRYLSRIPG